MKRMNHLEVLKKIVAGELPGAPVAEVLGFNVTEVEVGRVVV
jgi:hypothetical protein